MMKFLSMGIGIFLLQSMVYAELITPIPLSMDVDKAKVSLGKKLFSDPILSKDGTISCAHCHDLQNGGDDGLKFSFGIGGKQGVINSPTVYNAVFNFRQFWNGRAKDLKEQVLGPLVNPVEMGHTFDGAVNALKKNADYKKIFQQIYLDGVTTENLADAIAEFEKTLITPNAPFDRYLKGDTEAINAKTKKGYDLFISKGCIICHNGINVGGNSYNQFGVYSKVKSKNLGRYLVTQKEEDKNVFKVPSLRNVALTAPYMHDGRFETLKSSVAFMTKYQLGMLISDEEIEYMVAFLHALTGEIPKSSQP